MKINLKFLAIFTLIGGLVSHAQNYEKIISIGGGITETVYALGGQDKLIAKDGTSYFPPETKELPDIGYMRALSAEPIFSLGPDLILAKEGSGPAPVIDQLKSLGVKIEMFPIVKNLDELYAQNLKIGGIIGKTAEAEALNTKLQAKDKEIEELKTQLKTPPRVLVLLSMSQGSYRAAGGDTGAQQMVSYTGAINIFADQKGYKNINAEGILEQKPDFIFVGYISENEEDRALAKTKFLKSGILADHFDEAQILAFDPLVLFNLGLRNFDTAEEIIKTYLEQAK